MDQVGEEVSTNDINGNAELNRIECNLSLKSEGHNMLKSPITCASERKDWPDSSIHNFKNAIESKGLHRCVGSLVASEPPSTSPCYMNDSSAVIEELTVGNYRAGNLAIVSPNSFRQGQWQNLHLLASGSGYAALPGDSISHDNDRFLLRVREQFMKMTSDVRSPNFSSRKQIDQVPEEVSPYIRARENMIISSNTTPFGNAQLKTLSTPGFSQLFLKKNLKGKAVISRNTVAQSDLVSAVAKHNDGKIGCASSKIASGSLLKSTAKYNMISSHGVSRPSPEALHAGICLRECLKPGCRKREKVENLHIFRQIVELVDSAHSQGVALQDLRPSYLYLSPSNKVIYVGSSAMKELDFVVNQDQYKKRPLEQDMQVHCGLGVKQQKLSDDIKPFPHKGHFSSGCSSRTKKWNENDDLSISEYVEVHTQSGPTYVGISTKSDQHCLSATAQPEEKWYISPEELNDGSCTLLSNIYGLGVLLFELLCYFESSEVHSAAMSNLRHRILPSNFLSENPKDAGFCLWLLHPEPSSRPTTREILQSDFVCISHELHSWDNYLTSADDDEAESELLLHFLVPLKEQKVKHASKLVEAIRCLEEDIKEVEGKHLRKMPSVFSQTREDCFNDRKQDLYFEDPMTSVPLSHSFSVSSQNEARLMRNIAQLEDAYFLMRLKIQQTETGATAGRSDKHLLRNRDRWFGVQNVNESSITQTDDPLGAFFEGLCKFTRYSKFEVCGTLRNGDLLNSANVICSLSFDRDEEYIAAAGVSKRIKIFEFNSLLSDSIDIHYPVVEMSNKSKLSCVCWNGYIKNYLASTDYDGVVQMWDASTGQGFSQYAEHQKRAWSVDFSPAAPTNFASGSDDCSVKLWSINEKNSIATIRNPANVCCVQFSAFSTHLLVFGSADYKLHCYDIRNTRVPWCSLAGHEKAVSYVKFLDSETIVSASTDNTLKLWDLRKSSPTGLSSEACSLTFSGHTNEKNFVGLSVLDGYIVCGSETNEVYSYYRSMPMPITSHKFGSIDPISEHENGDDNGQFVSSVCWRQKSNMVVAANSSGCIKLLQMV